MTRPYEAERRGEAVRSYPREWWCVPGYYRADIKSRIFAGETTHKLRTSEGRLVNKAGQYENWFPTREEAEAVLAKRHEAEAYADKMKRMREAAPELVEALREALAWDGEDECGVPAVWASTAVALLARIEGSDA